MALGSHRFNWDIDVQSMEDLRKNLHFESGGTLFSRIKDADIGDNYVLVIGLGGAGIKALSQVKTTIQESLVKQIRTGLGTLHLTPTNLS